MPAVGDRVMARQWPIVKTTLWDGTWEFCHGHLDGLPVFAWRSVPARLGLATRRQLREMSLRPGGADPVALLRFRHRQPYRREELAELFRIELAKPKRTATPSQRAAIERALTARRTCPTCPPGQQVKPYYLPTSAGQCWDCYLPDTAAA